MSAPTGLSPFDAHVLIGAPILLLEMQRVRRRRNDGVDARGRDVLQKLKCVSDVGRTAGRGVSRPDLQQPGWALPLVFGGHGRRRVFRVDKLSLYDTSLSHRRFCLAAGVQLCCCGR